jgi:hypothetical protein
MFAAPDGFYRYGSRAACATTWRPGSVPRVHQQGGERRYDGQRVDPRRTNGDREGKPWILPRFIYGKVERDHGADEAD